ncbi:hypothetical protein ECA0467 [Pectobacterium atrosepticum SCRI1043]|uniref:Uncharacterized protein n=1 Tax=Pectobacterium atrosepticum (strain SCRI 1043 / ATCC BAA-672) TaxID=218491 RepID=Q6D9Z6_PECAS|nr:hypothetical protein [Pectobacterium atrosepticum]AIA69470.1 hypothetical protein EV46_02425 [Pectobacterium atrosepticum]AIK12373.1 hypothetical protein GZ59_04840 [Pectobacterium atrosepticum]KFX23901.1 hypothetical protein KP24_12255 [Pectobacterium atrosepticum]MCL6316677.1 hypothetical protein [Pectobacterium atrosepticum]MCL6321220.1 hypothetical protein [Pectobacterium atrosepticum]
MSLSVSNTGHSNSQAQSTAIPSATTPLTTEPTTTDSVQTVSPITGKTVTFSNNIKISAEAVARLKENRANTPPATLSQEEQDAMQGEVLKTRNLMIQRETHSTLNLPIDYISTNEMALELWSNNLKADSSISKDEFVDLVHQALSKPSDVTTWSYTTDSIEITLKAAKLEELKNRYVDSGANQNADKDIQDFITYQSDALSNLEKNILQDEYQRSVDAGDTDKTNSTFLELQRNAEGTSATQIQRRQIFSLAASTRADSLFDSFRSYVSATTADRYTKSDHLSVVSKFQTHWLQFQQQLK